MIESIVFRSNLLYCISIYIKKVAREMQTQLDIAATSLSSIRVYKMDRAKYIHECYVRSFVFQPWIHQALLCREQRCNLSLHSIQDDVPNCLIQTIILLHH